MKSNDLFPWKNLYLWILFWITGGAIIDWGFRNAEVYSFGIGSIFTLLVFAVVLGTSGPFPLWIILFNIIQRRNSVEAILMSVKINKLYPDWVKEFDKQFELDGNKDIELLFRGISKDSPNKIIAIIKARSNILVSYIKDKANLGKEEGFIVEIDHIKFYQPVD